MIANQSDKNNNFDGEQSLSAANQIRARVLEFINSYLVVNDSGPNPFEISDGIKLPPNYVNCAILHLLDDGIITQDKSHRVYLVPKNVTEPDLDNAIDIALSNAHRFGFKQFKDLEEAINQADRYFEVLGNLIASKLSGQYRQDRESPAATRARIRKLFFAKLVERFEEK